VQGRFSGGAAVETVADNSNTSVRSGCFFFRSTQNQPPKNSHRQVSNMSLRRQARHFEACDRPNEVRRGADRVMCSGQIRQPTRDDKADSSRSLTPVALLLRSDIDSHVGVGTIRWLKLFDAASEPVRNLCARSTFSNGCAQFKHNTNDHVVDRPRCSRRIAQRTACAERKKSRYLPFVETRKLGKGKQPGRSRGATWNR